MLAERRFPDGVATIEGATAYVHHRFSGPRVFLKEVVHLRKRSKLDGRAI